MSTRICRCRASYAVLSNFVKNELIPTPAAVYLEKIARRLRREASVYDRFSDDQSRSIVQALVVVAEEIEAVLREEHKK